MDPHFEDHGVPWRDDTCRKVLIYKVTEEDMQNVPGGKFEASDTD
jgi:hypothetical protein